MFIAVFFPPALHLGSIVSSIHLRRGEIIDGIHGPIIRNYSTVEHNETQV